VVASEKNDPVFNDPMAVLCLERLMSIASIKEKKWIIRQKRMINAHDARAMARRVAAFDNIANLFISNNPKCIVINLGCGFDTRFWRIENNNCNYIEIDLPEVVAMKREILKHELSYELIGCSVLDVSWIDKVITNGNSNFLLLAEGLFMFLPMQDVKNLIQLLAQKLIRSQLVVEMAHEKWTNGFWKMMFALQARVWGLDVSYTFGIKDPRDLESYAPGLRVLDDVKGSSVGPIVIVSINAT
jgi:O-methyltransferase involved in polyketide biosynthesis